MTSSPSSCHPLSDRETFQIQNKSWRSKPSGATAELLPLAFLIPRPLTWGLQGTDCWHLSPCNPPTLWTSAPSPVTGTLNSHRISIVSNTPQFSVLTTLPAWIHPPFPSPTETTYKWVAVLATTDWSMALFPLLSPGLGTTFPRLALQGGIPIGFLQRGALGFPHSSIGKESACNARDPGLIPGSGRSPGGGVGYPLQYSWASLVAQLVKNSPAMRETFVLSLGWEDPLEKGKATHSSVLAYSPWDHKESDATKRFSLSLFKEVHCCRICRQNKQRKPLFPVVCTLPG